MKKFYSTLSTTLEREPYEKLYGDIHKYVPYETISSVMRTALYLMLTIGIDKLAEKGLFKANPAGALNAIADKING